MTAAIPELLARDAVPIDPAGDEEDHELETRRHAGHAISALQAAEAPSVLLARAALRDARSGV